MQPSVPPNQIETLRSRSSATRPRARNVGVGAKDFRPLGLVHTPLTFRRGQPKPATYSPDLQYRGPGPTGPSILAPTPNGPARSTNQVRGNARVLLAGLSQVLAAGGGTAEEQRRKHGKLESEADILHVRGGRSEIESREPGPGGLVVSTQRWAGRRRPRGAGMRISVGRGHVVIGWFAWRRSPLHSDATQLAPAAFPDLPPCCKWPVGATACPGFHPFLTKEMLRRDCSHREMGDCQHVPLSR